MESYALFFGALFLLYVLSRVITVYLSQLLYFHTRSQHMTIYVTALIFFPGVVIHELSHYLTAQFLGVRAFGIEFLPKMIDGRLKLGSVTVSKTDPVRRTLIAVAPVIGGCITILGLVYLYRNFVSENYLLTFLVALLIYQVSNTMFSSKKDIEGTWIFAAFLSVLMILLWVAGVPVIGFLLTSDIGIFLQGLFFRGSYYLGIAVAVDLVAIVILFILKKLSGI